jgi:hypothetical protein
MTFLHKITNSRSLFLFLSSFVSKCQPDCTKQLNHQKVVLDQDSPPCGNVIKLFNLSLTLWEIFEPCKSFQQSLKVPCYFINFTFHKLLFKKTLKS